MITPETARHHTTSHPRKLTAADANDGVNSGPSWSPDGTQIAFSGFPRGDESEGIWIVNVDGTNLHRIATGGDAPAWSPDGTRIASVYQDGYWLMAVTARAAPRCPATTTGRRAGPQTAGSPSTAQTAPA